MTESKQLARQAFRGALETRRRIKVSAYDPVCVYDVAEELGVEVRFCSGDTFGGMYVKTSKAVLVPAMRPTGRQAFTCAHELGHWYFGHGNRIELFDESEAGSDDDPEERLANFFAAYFLMPPWSVTRQFERRGFSQNGCSPVQLYVIACQLGVGYTTLIHHMRWSLNTLPAWKAKELLALSPKDIRRSILGFNHAGHLIIADQAWERVAVDLQVGDLAILPKNAEVEGASVGLANEHDLGPIIEARKPGISRIEIRGESWSTYVRVSRKNFVGRSVYRHLEDSDVDDDASLNC